MTKGNKRKKKAKRIFIYLEKPILVIEMTTTTRMADGSPCVIVGASRFRSHVVALLTTNDAKYEERKSGGGGERMTRVAPANVNIHQSSCGGDRIRSD